MRREATCGGVSLCGVLCWALAMGWVQLRLSDGLAGSMLAAAPPQTGGQQMPEDWIREFDRRRERLLDRLDSRMDELRRRLERNQGPSKMMFARCG